MSRDVTTTAAYIYCQEETCNDQETTHLPEQIAYLALEHDGAHKIRALAAAPRPRSRTRRRARLPPSRDGR